MEPSNWAPEHSGALQENLALGMSYSEIARAINAKFGTHYTRSATISRARRIGIGGPKRSRDLAPLPPRDRQVSVRLLRKRFAAMSKWFVPEFKPVKMPALRCADIEPRHLSLLELEAGDCRYPYGGDAAGEAITFCGHPKREDFSYCTAHFRLTRGSGAMRERAVGAALLANRGGGMSPAVAVMIKRMKPLPRRHRIAHLRALIRQPSLGSRRRDELAAFLRAELMEPPAKQGRET